MNRLYVLLLLLVASSCSIKPEPIQYGDDSCAFCRMTIMDHRFGSELVTSKGKVFKFDSIECLIEYVEENENKGEAYHLVLVTPFDQPGRLIGAGQSHVLHSRNLPSPMGMYLTAFETEETAMKFKEQYGGKLYSWDSLKDNFKVIKTIGPAGL